MNRSHRSVGITLLVIFFATGALICLVTTLALAFPGSFLESIWRLKPEAREQFQKIGSASVALMTVVARLVAWLRSGSRETQSGDAVSPSVCLA